MSDAKEDIWKQLGDPVHLPLIISCPGRARDNPALIGAATPPTLTLQLDTQSGQHFLLPLTVKAARQLLVGLAGTLQLLGYPLEEEPNEPGQGH